MKKGKIGKKRKRENSFTPQRNIVYCSFLTHSGILKEKEAVIVKVSYFWGSGRPGTLFWYGWMFLIRKKVSNIRQILDM
jgi:hypothetical protein